MRLLRPFRKGSALYERNAPAADIVYKGLTSPGLRSPQILTITALQFSLNSKLSLWALSLIYSFKMRFHIIAGILAAGLATAAPVSEPASAVEEKRVCTEHRSHQIEHSLTCDLLGFHHRKSLRSSEHLKPRLTQCAALLWRFLRLGAREPSCLCRLPRCLRG